MAENKAIWNKVGISGTYRGHPSGPFSLSAQTFAEIEKNFKTDNIPIPIDWDHAMEQPVSGSIAKSMGEAPAAGWVRDVQVRGSELWAFTEWLPETRDKIKSGAYKFVSPAIRFGAIDPVTGKNVGARLSSLACTNKPFLRALPPLQANDATDAFLCSEVTGAELVELTAQSAGYAMHQNQFLPAFRRMLGMDDLASPGDMLDKVDRLSELCDMADGDPSATVEGVNLGNYIPSLRQFMAMPANTTLGELLDAVCEMIGSTIDCDDDSAGADMSDTVSVDAPIPTTPIVPVIAQQDNTNIMDANTITLSDHEAKVTSAVASAVTAEVAKATAPLTLQLSDVRSKLETALSEKAAADAKIVELSDQIKKQAEATANSRVEEAFETYKETKKLSENDKKAMGLVLASDVSLFDTLYPKIAPTKAFLLRTVAATDTNTAASASAKVVPDLKVLLADVQQKNPSKTYDECFTMALAEQTKLMAG